MAMVNRQSTLLILFLAALSFQKVGAQEVLPPLDKTIKLLRPKITNSIVVDTQMYGKKSPKQQVTEWNLDNPSRCILVWKGWQTEEKAERGAAKSISVEINLADFDPQRISTGKFIFSNLKRTDTTWTVFLETTNKKNAVNWRSMNGSFSSSVIAFRFGDEEIAYGVIRAFQHAINLCGGKSKPNEPDPFFRKKEGPLRPRY